MDTETTAQAAALLKDHDLEPTAHRLTVVAALAELGMPASAPELLEREDVGGAMNKVTLYRILDLLENAHLVQRFHGPGGAARYCLDAEGAGHAHFACRACGKALCLDSVPGWLDRKGVEKALGVTIDGIELKLLGLCVDCGAGQNGTGLAE